MRSPSRAFCRPLRATGMAGLRSARPGAGRRWLLCGALLLVGLTGALGARATEMAAPAGADPRPAVPIAPGGAAALNVPMAAVPPRGGLVDEASKCEALAEAPSGTITAIAGATGLPPGTFRGFAGDLQTAAEPPPPLPQGASPTNPSATQAGSPGSGAPGAVQTAPITAASSAALASRTILATPAVPAAAAARSTPPPPQPHPALGFDAAFGVPRQPYGKLIYQIARSYALNPLLVAAIARVESDFNPRARSRKGACGLMQVLPETARRFGLQRRRELFNPRQNLVTASRYLRWLVDRFGDDPVRVLAAYNAGEGAVDRFGGVPPFAETRDYVQRIFGLLGFSVLLESPAAAAATAATSAVSATWAVAGAR